MGHYAKADAIVTAPVVSFPLCESTLVRCLGCQIKRVEADKEGTLELHFSNEDVLIIYANDPQYEAYTLVIGGKEYVV